MTDAELLQALDYLRNTMIAVSTGGQGLENFFECAYLDFAQQDNVRSEMISATRP